jgi:DNA/RNA endonuclease YhcR with UshA esterase domain
MRALMFALLGSMLWLSTVRSEEPAKPLTPAEAAKKVNETVTLQMEVKSASTTKTGVSYLNSEDDFKSEKNFTIFIDKGVAAKFKEAKIEDPAAHFKGKLIEVKGKVTLFKDRAQIKLDGPDAIKIVEKKK